MKLFVPNDHRLHHPGMDLSDGLPGYPYPEVPDRIERILDAVRQLPHRVVRTSGGSSEADVRELHDPGYVDFLKRLTGALDDGEEFIPTIFAHGLQGAPLRIQAGMYCQEVGTPIGRGTYAAALGSAAAALEAADELILTRHSTGALCRPPGHHAGRARYGGYCFFNNAYLAATRIARAGLSCAVLDIDYHLGEGSTEFSTEKVPYYSIHADPHRNYPYVPASWKPDPRSNFLFQIDSECDGTSYCAQLGNVLNRIKSAHFDVLVISLGLDVLGTDHIQDQKLNLTPADLGRVGGLIGELGYINLIILEGGYDLQRIGPAFAIFLQNLESVRKDVR